MGETEYRSSLIYPVEELCAGEDTARFHVVEAATIDDEGVEETLREGAIDICIIDELDKRFLTTSGSIGLWSNSERRVCGALEKGPSPNLIIRQRSPKQLIGPFCLYRQGNSAAA
ncbi:hypothetical protein BHE74_00016674 [Ensete ventricosum]|nr:hypothetical protein BHE74_00016674 [Ensete ventricosum]RZR95418.1 hypothetical protein BHM03_00024270 [Ensete ventricosum]